jgi:hypothetical protein
MLTHIRAYALQRHRPLSLQATITLPTQNDDPSDAQAHHLTGFIHLVNLFRPFDESFVALWNKTRSDCSPAYLAALQKQLTDALPTYLNSTDNQAADLRTSQQWLRTMVWQLSMQNGCLSSGHEDPSMTFQYPVDISRDLVAMTAQFPRSSMEVHGIGLVCTLPQLSVYANVPKIEKLFDVACSLTDVLSLLPPNPDPFQLGPKDYLHDFMTLLSILRNGDNRFLPLLLSKVNDVLPRLVNPMLQTVPDTAANALCDVDIFDGFGNAGIGVPSQFPGYNGNGSSGEFKVEPTEQDFGNGTSSGMPSYDKRIEGLASPITAGESSDTSSFTSPPMLQSPMEYSGIDYTSYQNLNIAQPLQHMGHNNHNGNFGEGIGGGGGLMHQPDFKRDFDGTMQMLRGNVQPGMMRNGMDARRPPLRQESTSTYGLIPPRSMPDNQQYHHLQRTVSANDAAGLGMVGQGEMTFR